ncbi:MAG: hypothetical protein F4Z44_13510 [Gemmatimonadetes bacterium]|nr:hypothetical protein [Gemmatimonadota bacterium]
MKRFTSSAVNEGRRRLRSLFLPGVATLPVVAGCGVESDPLDPGPPDIESLVFAASLGVDLSEMTLLPSGLYIRDLTVGEGASVGQQQGARFNYQGWLHDGTPVDGGEYPIDQFSPGAFISPFDGEVYYLVGSGQTIAGWDIGLEGMRVGGARQIVVPPRLGFGAAGSLDGRVPGNAVLVYRFELLAVEP